MVKSYEVFEKNIKSAILAKTWEKWNTGRFKILIKFLKSAELATVRCFA